MAITLQFIGAARHVTGSKHLLIVNDKRVLLECGLVQGPRKIAAKASRSVSPISSLPMTLRSRPSSCPSVIPACHAMASRSNTARACALAVARLER